MLIFGLYGIGIFITCAYVIPYENAKKKGCLLAWNRKMLISHLWVMSFIITGFSVVICYSSKYFSEKYIQLKWESVLLLFLAIMINPFVVKGIWKRNKSLSTILPIICGMLTVYYLPFSGLSVSETVTLIWIGVVSVFAVGITVASFTVISIILIMLFIGLMSLPVVIAL